ncbi:cellular nucleic acid-binding protein, partial [Trifolium medium]|nr:cellular nucleic acid-binding protein [Trifolium medium]
DDKCVKFESGLRPDIKHMIRFSQIRDFATLVNKSRICDDDGRAKTSYYKAVNDRKGKGQERDKPYDNRGRGNTSGGRNPGNENCYKCGERGHMSYDCPKKAD